MVFKTSVKSGYTYFTKLISLRKQFLALYPWDITETFYVFEVIIKWDNLKKKCEICTAAYWSSVSRAQCQKDALLALQPVLRVCACLCGHRACWHRVRCLSQTEGARFGTTYFVFSAWSEPRSKLLHQPCPGVLVEGASLLTWKGAWKGRATPKVWITSNPGWEARLLNSVNAP